MMDFAAGGSVVLFGAVAAALVMAALAPIVYAARSGDVFTVIVCVIALMVCVGLVFEGKTVMDRIVVALVYLASAFMAVVVFAVTRIEAAIKGSSDGSGKSTVPARMARPD